MKKWIENKILLWVLGSVMVYGLGLGLMLRSIKVDSGSDLNIPKQINLSGDGKNKLLVLERDVFELPKDLMQVEQVRMAVVKEDIPKISRPFFRIKSILGGVKPVAIVEYHGKTHFLKVGELLDHWTVKIINQTMVVFSNSGVDYEFNP